MTTAVVATSLGLPEEVTTVAQVIFSSTIPCPSQLRPLITRPLPKPSRSIAIVLTQVVSRFQTGSVRCLVSFSRFFTFSLLLVFLALLLEVAE